MGEGATLGNQRVCERCISLVLPPLKVFVQGTDIFTSIAFKDNHYHVLFHKRMGWLGTMDGVENGCHLLFRCEVGGHIEMGLADGAQNGKGCVEHQTGLCGAVAVAVCRAHGNGTDEDAATHAHPTERGEEQKRQEGDQGVALDGFLANRQTGHRIAAPEEEADDKGNNEEIPVAHGLDAKDSHQVVFVLELVEHGDGRTAQGVFEVNGITQIHHQRQHVHNNEEPLAKRMEAGVLFLVPRKQQQQHPQRVGIDDGGSIEHERSLHEFPRMTPTDGVGEVTEVLHIEHQSGHEINHVGQKQVEHHGTNRPQDRMQDIEFLFHGSILSLTILYIYCWMMAFTSRSILACTSGSFPTMFLVIMMSSCR